MDEVFRALADPSRRELLDRLRTTSGQSLAQLCEGLEMSRQAVSKHLDILESAGLVVVRRQGREKLHHLNAAPINEIGERWIAPYDRARVRAIADLKRALEGNPMHDTDDTFIYATYIRTTPEKLWAMLTAPEWTQRWWDTTLETEWAPGAHLVWHHHGDTYDFPEQVVTAWEPYRRFGYTWHRFTPEWKQRHSIADDVYAKVLDEQGSAVTFEIEELDGMVRLTVIHDRFVPNGILRSMVSGGWPKLMSSVKSYLETGEFLSV